MLERMQELSPVIQALLATLFTWGLTALGAASVFLFKTINRKVLDFMLAFAGGVMIAASFWSLLAPAIEMAENHGQIAWIPASVGMTIKIRLNRVFWVGKRLEVGVKSGYNSASSIFRQGTGL